MNFRYKAIRVQQTNSDKLLAMFSAPATEIDAWAGVPQKKRFGTGEETAGFQREINSKRLKDLRAFYVEQDNIIQNPLLCATRDIALSTVRFEPDAGAESADVSVGDIVIEIPNFAALDFEEILGRVRDFIENRVPELAEREPDPAVLATLKARAARVGQFSQDDAESDDATEEDASESASEANGNEDAAAVLFEESHIIDFWQEIAARHELVKLIDEPLEGDEFLGFTKEALLSYLRPVVLVDGQHRLRGALEAAKASLNDPSIQEEVERRITEGDAPEAIEGAILRREARRLPVSMLLSSDPAEQVFQFVVVNQKATPIGRALLGTIVSTSLSNDEMGTVAGRLKNAGIQLEESQAITYLARHPDSPFRGLVERGLAGDDKDLLQWNVFASLIYIFRHLRGGNLYDQPRNDYADIWRRRHLESSDIIAGYESQGHETPYEYWYQLNGPWRQVFIRFWTKIRDVFGNTTDRDKHNYWGRTRSSNLFNKVSLTILTADFFQWLVETSNTLNSTEHVDELVDRWLEHVNTGYFDKDWHLAGTKKDSPGIRKRWAELWTQYRKGGGSLPDRRLFRQAKAD